MIRLRRADAADALLLRRWDGQPHVIAATGADAKPDTSSDWSWDEELARAVSWRQFLIGEVDRRPVGVMQVIDPHLEETHYWGEIETGLRAVDIWIGEESDLGRGFGGEMMRLATAGCFTDETVQAILVDPMVRNMRAHRFYERFGFKRLDRRMFGEDDCYVYRLDRADWEPLRS